MDTIINLINTNTNILLIILTTLTLLILLKIINKNIKKTTNQKNKTTTNLKYPLITILIILILQTIIITNLENNITTQTNTSKIILTLIIILITYSLSIIGSTTLHKWTQNTKNKETQQNITELLQNTQNTLLAILATIFILTTWNLNANTSLIIIGLAMIITTIALNDTLKNIINGINLAQENTFKKGDLIELEDEERGYVINTSLKYTTIKNFDFKEIHIPNTKLANMKIKNYAQPTSTHRIKINLPLLIGTNLKKTEELILKHINNNENILKYPLPRIYATKIATDQIELAITFFIKDYHDLTIIQSEITKELYITLTKNKILNPKSNKR